MDFKTHNIDWDFDISDVWVFPGSFNPLHDGHVGILREVTLTHGFAVFEISKVNVEKPTLTDDEVTRRLSLFGDYPAIVTEAPRFVDKLKYGARKFVVGADTLHRIMWHFPVQDIMDLESSGVKFIVSPRNDMLEDRNLYKFTCDLPKQCRILIGNMVVDVLNYKSPLSSTQIRKEQNEK